MKMRIKRGEHIKTLLAKENNKIDDF